MRSALHRQSSLVSVQDGGVYGVSLIVLTP